MLGAVAGAFLTPAAAHASPSDSVTMFGRGDMANGGVPLNFTPSNSRIFVRDGGPRFVDVDVRTPNGGRSYYLSFVAPANESLTPGVYEVNGVSAGSYGYMNIGGYGGCQTTDGRFEVKKFELGPDGVPTQVWIVYERQCEMSHLALFGEVRIGLPARPESIDTSPSIVRWPELDAGATGTGVPVVVTSSSGARIGTVSIEGRDASLFAKERDECSGRTLAPGASCEVWVHFAPRPPGTRWAKLRVSEAGGAVDEIELEGFAYGGSTRLVMHSDPGDPVGEGREWAFTPANAALAPYGSHWGGRAWFEIYVPAGSYAWSGDFDAPSGQVFAEGQTYTVHDNSLPSLYVNQSYPHPECSSRTGEFTMNELRLDPQFDVLSMDIDFEQHCDGATPALRGSFQFRVGDDTPLAPWIVAPPGKRGPPVDMPDGEDEPPYEPPDDEGSSGDVSGDAPATSDGDQVAGSAGGSSSDSNGQRRAERCGDGAAAQRSPLRGTRRADRLVGTAGPDRLLAGPGRDRVWARRGADCIDAGRGDDRVDGGAGADLLIGGPGNDVLSGGTGSDRFRCGPGPRDVARAVQPGERVVGCELVLRRKRR